MVNVTLDRQNLMTFAQDNEMSVQEKKKEILLKTFLTQKIYPYITMAKSQIIAQ